MARISEILTRPGIEVVNEHWKDTRHNGRKNISYRDVAINIVSLNPELSGLKAGDEVKAFRREGARSFTTATITVFPNKEAALAAGKRK